MTQTSISSQLDNKDISTNKNKNNTSNINDIHSCVTPQKKVSVQATSTTTRLKPLNDTIHIVSVQLHKTKQLAPAVKEYLCFHINKTYYHAAQCVKSLIMNNSIDSILSIDKFYQQCVEIKVELQSPHIEDHMTSIGNNQSL